MNFNDTVAWFLNSDTYSSYDYCFFTQIVGSADSNNLKYTTLSEFYTTPSKLTQEFPIFSVERLDDDRIILTLEFTPGFLVPTSIALFSEDSSGKKFLVARIVTNEGSTKINSSYERIFSIPLPYKMKGNVKEYPSFYPSIRRKSGSPSGGEKVTVGEHHHSVSVTIGGNTTYESFPDTTLMTPNFIKSAVSLNWVNPSSNLAMTLNERGSSDSSTVNAMGFKDSSNLISTVSRVITQTIMDSIVNYLEVLVMANNKIQILGKQIPKIENNAYGYPSSEGENLYVLTSDSVSPTSNRQLKAIPYDVFRKSIVGKKEVSSDTLTTTSAINYVKSSRDFTLTSSNQAPQIAIVVNTKDYPKNTGKMNDKATTTAIKVTYSGGKVEIPAQGVAIFETQTGGRYEECISLTDFTQKYLSDIMEGRLVSSNLKVNTLDIVNNASDNTYVTVTVDKESMVNMSGVKN